MISNRDNILFFTMHRSGSMFIHFLCGVLSKLGNMTYYSPNGGDFQFSEQELATNKYFFIGKKGCFAPIRFYVDMTNIKDSNIILHLRDPRDVLVSMFFSYCYSHGGSLKGYTGYRKEIADLGIDNFVLRMVAEANPRIIGGYGTGEILNQQGAHIGNVKKRYEDYIANLLQRQNVIFVKYEEMVNNFENYLKKVIVPFNISSSEKTIRELLTTKDFFKTDKEDIWSHKRKVIPGDYKEKLKPETILELNQILQNILKVLDYAI